MRPLNFRLKTHKVEKCQQWCNYAPLGKKPLEQHFFLERELICAFPIVHVWLTMSIHDSRLIQGQVPI